VVPVHDMSATTFGRSNDKTDQIKKTTAVLASLLVVSAVNLAIGSTIAWCLDIQ
jgi:hypothetical protein